MSLRDWLFDRTLPKANLNEKVTGLTDRSSKAKLKHLDESDQFLTNSEERTHEASAYLKIDKASTNTKVVPS